MNRVYTTSQWERDFAKAFAAAVPLESMHTQARGALLAADNDEPEPDILAAIRKAQRETQAITGTVSHPTPLAQLRDECDEAQAVEHRLGLTRMGGAA